jgi:hypothetical protein
MIAVVEAGAGLLALQLGDALNDTAMSAHRPIGPHDGLKVLAGHFRI